MRKTILLLAFTLGLLSVFAADTAYSKPVQFYSGSYKLGGELILPKAKEKVPAIVFVVGSGAGTSFRTTYKRMLQEAFEKQLIPEGIALLYYEKRGVSPSEGVWYQTDFYERAQDTKAAIDFLKTVPEIDASRIGVVGHSQGGWIAQLTAARYPQDVAFAVSLAGPTYSVKKQVLNDYETQFLCKGFSPAKAHRKAVRANNAAFVITFIAPVYEHWKQLKLIGRYNPEKEIKKINRPILLLFGENDGLVYPDWNISTLQKMFNNAIPENIEYQVIKGVNHEFLLADRCYKGSYKALSFSEEFKTVLKNWILKQVKKG